MEIENVLVVDDEDDIRLISELSLRKLGNWQVQLAASGEEALRTAREEPPDLILLDVMMPDLDGPGTLSRLQGQPETATIPVIFMTAKVQKHEVDGYLELGAAGVISKPFDPMTLPDEIRAIVRDL